MGDSQRFFPLVRSNRGYRCGACIWHIAPRAIGTGRRRIGFLSSMLDHFVAVFPGAQTWLRQCVHSCRHGHGASVRHARWRNSDEPIWMAPVFPRGGPGEPVMVTAMASLDAKRPYRFRLASGTLRARHVADSEAAVSLGNMCRSILYELLAVLSPDLAAVLPGARTSFFLGRDGEDRWVGLFPDGCLSHVRRIASGKTPTLVRKTFMVVGQVGAGISLAACVISGPVLSVVCLLLAAAFWGISASNT